MELELIMSERLPLAGQARAPGLPAARFSGWSELFAVLQTMVSGCEAYGEKGTGQETSCQYRPAGDQEESP